MFYGCKIIAIEIGLYYPSNPTRNSVR